MVQCGHILLQQCFEVYMCVWSYIPLALLVCIYILFHLNTQMLLHNVFMCQVTA